MDQQQLSRDTMNVYPINVRFDRDQRINRLWGIPLFGWMLRALVLIPHFIVLWLFGFVVTVVTLIDWIPVLFTGRFPGWGYDLLGGYYRWYTRVLAYMLLMVGPYPPFTTRRGYPVEVDFDRSTRLNPLWGVPMFGVAVRALLAIPHLIVLWVLGVIAGLISVFAWIPVLIYGRYPGVGYELVGGYLRWSTRVSCWILLMAGPYPPFRTGE